MNARNLLCMLLLASTLLGCTAKAQQARLTCLTYNVLADRDADSRLAPLLAILRDSDADIIALQEVAPWFLQALSANEWAKQRYNVAASTPHGSARGGLLLLSKHPAHKTSYLRLPGKQGRGVRCTHYRIGGREVRVATVHLESPLKDGPTRAVQLQHAFRLLAGAETAILLGDVNFGDGEEPETAAIPPDFIDCWTKLRPGDPGFTWDIEASDMARRGSFVGEQSRRIDRILIRSTAWEPSSVTIVGAAPVSNGIFPSDHFGVLAVLKMKE